MQFSLVDIALFHYSQVRIFLPFGQAYSIPTTPQKPKIGPRPGLGGELAFEILA